MTKSKGRLHIGRSGGKAFDMPVDFVTERASILAVSGAGKSYTGHVIAEGLLKERQQVVAIDPMNAWWGLRSGYKVVIFGGPQGDLPLEATSGRALADAVAEHPDLSCVLSLRHLRKTKMRQFVTDFAEQLFHRKGEPTLSTPMHLFIDEADLFAPQKVGADLARMVGAVEDVVRRGRQSGIGVTTLTQRPASLNKDVLTQSRVLIAGELTGPHDKNAIKDWIKDNANIEKQTMFIRSLPQLQTGEFWFWSPKFLRCLARVNVKKKRTFDASATPKVGSKSRRPKMKAKPVDLAALRTALADTIKQAEEKDPKALRRKIVELEKELRKQINREGPPVSVASGHTAADIRRLVGKAVAARDAELKGRATALVSSLTKTMTDFFGSMSKAKAPMLASIHALARPLPPLGKVTVPSVSRAAVTHPARTASVPLLVPQAARSVDSSNGLGRCERAVLTVLAQRGRRCTRRLVALQAGYSITSGGFKNSISALRTKGYLEGREEIAITDAGLEGLGGYEPLPTGDDLIAHWKGRLKPKAVREVFACIAAAYPDELTTGEVAERTGYRPTSGGFKNALSALRTLELIVGRGEVVLSAEIHEG